MARSKGWRMEPARHSLAAKGVETKYLSVPIGEKVDVDSLRGYWLVDGHDMAARYPATFQIPSGEDIEKLGKGSLVKMIFNGQEKMWVKVTKRVGDEWEGVLDNEPFGIPNLHLGDKVKFHTRNITSYWEGKE